VKLNGKHKSFRETVRSVLLTRSFYRIRLCIHYKSYEPPMVREVPDYARQYLIEHPEFGPPIESKKEQINPTPEPEPQPTPDSRSAGVPARKAVKPVAQREANAEPRAAHQNAAQERATTEPAADRRKNTAHGASRGAEPANNPAPKERKTPDRDSSGEDAQEYERIQQAEAAIAGALKGNWRDLRTVFDFAGISEPNKEAPR
jgi:hypothetical protein